MFHFTPLESLDWKNNTYFQFIENNPAKYHSIGQLTIIAKRWNVLSTGLSGYTYSAITCSLMPSLGFTWITWLQSTLVPWSDCGQKLKFQKSDESTFSWHQNSSWLIVTSRGKLSYGWSHSTHKGRWLWSLDINHPSPRALRQVFLQTITWGGGVTFINDLLSKDLKDPWGCLLLIANYSFPFETRHQLKELIPVCNKNGQYCWPC